MHEHTMDINHLVTDEYTSIADILTLAVDIDCSKRNINTVEGYV